MTYVEDFVATSPMRDLKWRTKEGVYYYPWEMTDSHLKNCLLHIEGLYGGQAPHQIWHQIFRCELKRREVQNAHQPPKTTISYAVSPLIPRGEVYSVSWARADKTVAQQPTKTQRPPTKKTRVKATRKGRKTR